jgi:hypothetical protein
MGVFAYSSLNYLQNSFFGISSIGNVNMFGKILQYKMEGLGDNYKLQNDIVQAYENESKEFIVNEGFLEPWHFIGVYGWSSSNYAEVGRFSRKIILQNPMQYMNKSLKLAWNLLIYNSPFRDYIAEGAIARSAHPDIVMFTLKQLTDKLNKLYLLLLLPLFELVFLFLLPGRRQFKERVWQLAAVYLIILYHYVITAFLSYGDYCRLLVPSYFLMYALMCLYIFRLIKLPLELIKRLHTKPLLKLNK